MVNTPNPVDTGKQDLGRVGAIIQETNAYFDQTGVHAGELQVEQTTKESVAQILFNPSDPKYKKVEDLPRAFRDDFINTEDETGFVRKDADKNYMEAQRQADKNIRHGKTEGLNTMDVLYNSALSEELILENIIESGSFCGTRKDDELYEKKVLTRNFFMRLVEGEVTFLSPETIPLRLRNDKEFLLKLAEKTRTRFSPKELLSNQILQTEGNDFLFKLVEVGGIIYFESEKIINKYFADKDHLFVIDYLNKNINNIKNENTFKIYLAIIEKFKDNRSIGDILEIILKKYPGLARGGIITNSYELRSIALGIFKKMPQERQEKVSGVIGDLESYNK